MPRFNVKIIYEFEIEAKDDCHAEEKAYERMEDYVPDIEIEEIE